MDRNRKILLGLLVVLAIALVYRLANPFRQQTVDRLTHTPAKTVPIEPAASGAPPARVQVDLLRSPPSIDVSVERNPFQPPAVATAPQKTAPPAPPAPKPLSPREKIEAHFERFKTFGSVRFGGKTYLFLERGKQVLVVSRGDRIDGKYEVVAVGEKSMTVSAPELEAPLEIDFEAL